MKQKNDCRASKAAASVVTGLAAIFGGASPASAKVPSFYAESAIVSDYVAPHGAILEGTVNQNMVCADFNNGLSGFVWQNHDFESNRTNEIDAGILYTQKINNHWSASAGFQHWDYLNGQFGDHDDNVLKAGIKYSNGFDLKYDLTHMFGHDQTHTGTRQHFNLSKSLNLGKLADATVSLTPHVGTSIVDDYYGFKGHSQITYGVDFGLTKGEWNFRLSLNQQDGKIFDDQTWVGAYLGYSFGGK